MEKALPMLNDYGYGLLIHLVAVHGNDMNFFSKNSMPKLMKSKKKMK